MHYTNTIIEELLRVFKPILQNDYDKYKHHIYRVFLNCLLQDNIRENEDKYAIAVFFHDIGIWTNNTIDYLSPSMKEASSYLTKVGKDDWKDEINLMINFHHKVSRYKGLHEKTVETFRKADWIDVTWGLMTFDVDKQAIRRNKRLLPNLGFHFFLIRKITMNFFKHPLNPLPMFKK